MGETPEQDDGSDTAPVIDLASGLLLAGLAGLALVWIIPANVDADAGDYDVSPIFMPKLIAWVVLALGLALAGSAAKRARTGWQPASWTILSDTAGWAVASTLAYLALVHIGFQVTAPIIIAAGLWFAGQRSLILIVVLAIGLPLAIHTGAWQIFQVALP